MSMESQAERDKRWRLLSEYAYPVDPVRVEQVAAAIGQEQSQPFPTTHFSVGRIVQSLTRRVRGF